MSEQDLRPVSANTGQFAVLTPARGNAQPAGNTRSDSGKNVPEIRATNIESLESLARKLNIASRSIGRDLRFQVNMDSGQSVIQVLDRETGEIIRQIPPENAKSYLSDRGDVVLRLYDNRV